MNNPCHSQIDTDSIQVEHITLSENFLGSDAFGQFDNWLDRRLEELIRSQSRFASVAATRKSLGR